MGGDTKMEIITKAKKSCTAYEKPSPRKPSRGRQPKRGEAVHRKELFAKQFRKAKIELYGKQESIRYYGIDLLWGQGLYQELKFVLVEMGGIQSILACTSLEFAPLAIIRLYSYRFRIELTFMELKQQIGAFCYHFWSKSLPKLSYYQKKGSPSPMERVKNDAAARENVKKAIRATEMHMGLACIAMEILPCLSIHFNGQIDARQIRYQRTPARGRVSEGALMDYFRRHFFRLMGQQPDLRITQTIQKRQEKSGIYWDSLAS